MATKISTEDWIEELKGISVLELSERIKALEEEFGVSATAVADNDAATTARIKRMLAFLDEGLVMLLRPRAASNCARLCQNSARLTRP